MNACSMCPAQGVPSPPWSGAQTAPMNSARGQALAALQLLFREDIVQEKLDLQILAAADEHVPDLNRCGISPVGSTDA